MSTRSIIGKKNQDGTVSAVYCHFDGYLSGVGEVLLNHYQDPEKVDQLIGLGDLSSIGKEIGTKHPFDNRPEEECTFYGRDREEERTEAKIFWRANTFWNSRRKYGAEYVYLMDGGKWFVREYDGEIMELSSAIEYEKKAVAE